MGVIAKGCINDELREEIKLLKEDIGIKDKLVATQSQKLEAVEQNQYVLERGATLWIGGHLPAEELAQAVQRLALTAEHVRGVEHTASVMQRMLEHVTGIVTSKVASAPVSSPLAWLEMNAWNSRYPDSPIKVSIEGWTDAKAWGP